MRHEERKVPGNLIRESGEIKVEFSYAVDTSRAGYSHERSGPTAMAFLNGSDIEIMRAMLVAARHKSRSSPA